MESNQALLQRVKNIENMQVTLALDKGLTHPHNIVPFPLLGAMTHLPTYLTPDNLRGGAYYSHITSPLWESPILDPLATHLQPHQGPLNKTQRGSSHIDLYVDSNTPNLYTLRRMPTISHMVTYAVAAYENQAKFVYMQGKHLRGSGHFNTRETVNSLHKKRWPNEGPQASTAKKRVRYDDLMLAQWITGQLSNIHHMGDQTAVMHSLLQVILAMKGTTLIPWTAVLNAWAMHDLEEGNRHLSNATQWSLNRISASQILMANSRVTQGNQYKKICKFTMTV